MYLLIHKSAAVYGQSYTLILNSNPLNFKFKANSDSIFQIRQIKKISNYYIVNGYATFNIDSISVNNKTKTIYAFLFIGKKYKIGNIIVSNDSGMPEATQNITQKHINSILDSTNFNKIIEDLLLNLENKGYPFAQIKAESLTEKKSDITLNLMLSKGPLFLFDTIQIEGNAKVKKKFLEAYLGLKSGNPYNETAYAKANEKLNQLPFLSPNRVPLMVFLNGGLARPYLYLQKKKSDQINGIIGLAPSAASGTQSQNLAFTGEFLLRLNNLFRNGKTIFINWRSFQARSQELKTGFNYPYLLGKPIGLDLGFELLKYDTLYTTLFRQIGFQYYTSGLNGFKIFYNVGSTNLNTVDTLSIKTSKQFPIINAVSIAQYGLTGNFNFLDYRFNPRKGWLIETTASAGSKTILRDNKIENIKFTSGGSRYNLYDSSVLKSNQYRLKLKLDKFFPIGSKSCIKIGTDIDRMIAPRIYFNEVLRLGGINSLKGFNEQSIFATNFNMLDIEYRYLLSSNSFVKAFWNGAYYEDNSYGKVKSSDTPWGFGIGANLETRAGILSIIYALGKEKNNKFDLRIGKIHFGISSYF